MTRCNTSSGREPPIDEHLAALFAALEGPETPIPRATQDPKRMRRFSIIIRPLASRPALITASAVSALGLVVGILTAIGGRPSLENHAGEASCAAVIRVGEIEYGGESTTRSYRLGRQVGMGFVPACRDSSGMGDKAAEPTLETSDGRRLAVYEIVGIDPRAALARSDQPDVVYIAPGRCIGASDAMECLRIPLIFKGRAYFATNVDIADSVPTQGPSIGKGQMGGQRATVVRLNDVSPRVAVGRPSMPEIVFVAVDQCLVDGPDRLVRCITE